MSVPPYQLSVDGFARRSLPRPLARGQRDHLRGVVVRRRGHRAPPATTWSRAALGPARDPDLRRPTRARLLRRRRRGPARRGAARSTRLRQVRASASSPPLAAQAQDAHAHLPEHARARHRVSAVLLEAGITTRWQLTPRLPRSASTARSTRRPTTTSSGASSPRPASTSTSSAAGRSAPPRSPRRDRARWARSRPRRQRDRRARGRLGRRRARRRRGADGRDAHPRRHGGRRRRRLLLSRPSAATTPGRSPRPRPPRMAPAVGGALGGEAADIGGAASARPRPWPAPSIADLTEGRPHRAGAPLHGDAAGGQVTTVRQGDALHPAQHRPLERRPPSATTTPTGRWCASERRGLDRAFPPSPLEIAAAAAAVDRRERWPPPRARFPGGRRRRGPRRDRHRRGGARSTSALGQKARVEPRGLRAPRPFLFPKWAFGRRRGAAHPPPEAAPRLRSPRARAAAPTLARPSLRARRTTPPGSSTAPTWSPAWSTAGSSSPGSGERGRSTGTRSSARPRRCRTAAAARSARACRWRSRRRSWARRERRIYVDEKGQIKVQFHWDREGSTTRTARAGSGRCSPGAAPGGGNPMPSCPRGGSRGVLGVFGVRAVARVVTRRSSTAGSGRRIKGVLRAQGDGRSELVAVTARTRSRAPAGTPERSPAGTRGAGPPGRAASRGTSGRTRPKRALGACREFRAQLGELSLDDLGLRAQLADPLKEHRVALRMVDCSMSVKYLVTAARVSFRRRSSACRRVSI